jgi:hypothetical protein
MNAYLTDLGHIRMRIAPFPIGERLRLTVSGPAVFALTTVAGAGEPST